MTRTLLSSTLAYLPVQLASPFVQFLVIVMWTHLLKPDAFGVVTFVIAAQELTGFIGLVWWSLFILRFQKRYVGDDAARLRDMDLRMAAYGSFIQALFAPFCLLALGVELDIATIGASAAYLAARTLLNHYSEWARSRHRVLAYSLAQICGPILGSGLSLITILAFGPSPAIALATMAVGQLIAVFGLMLALGIPPHLGAFARDIFVAARRYGAPTIVSQMFSWTAVNGVSLLVRIDSGVTGVGLLAAGWGLGQRIANVIAMVCTAAAYPLAVDRMESGDTKGALRHVAVNSALMFSLLAPAIAGVALLSKPIVGLIIAAEYRDVTTLVLPVSVAAGAMRMLKAHTADQTGLLLKRTPAFTVANFFDALITLACAAIGLKMGGIVGVAYGAMIGTIVSSCGVLTFAVFWLGLPLDLASFGRILVAVAMMVAALLVVPAPFDALQISAAIFYGAAVYGLAIVLLFEPVRELARRRLALIVRKGA